MKDLRKIIKNNDGIAIIMVMGTIAILTLVLAEFTFDTKINKIKAYNLQDKLQARLNAEAGLNFVLARLKIYQEGRNYIEKNDTLKQNVPLNQLEGVFTMPFVYPIPETPDMNLVAKEAVQDFIETSLLQGELRISVSAISGFINPNNMRIPQQDSKKKQDNPDDPNNENKKSPQEYIEQKLVDILKESIEKKSEEDDDFNALYANVDPILLIKEMKYFVNRKEDFTDSERADIEALYNSKNIEVKHAPFTSIEELYLLEGWDDALVDLIKDRLTVHEVSFIAINDITKEQLEVIFPNISEIQAEEFFKYRDGDPEVGLKPHPFQNVGEFKNTIVNYVGLMGESQYEERIKELEQAGLKIGVAGKLFKAEILGIYRRSTFKLTAFIDLPVKPEPLPSDDKNKNGNNPENPEEDPSKNPDDPENPGEDPGDDPNQKKKELPLELLTPRVIEVRYG